MSNKYTVQVRININKNRNSTVGYSSYDAKSYDSKFKNAVLNAVYSDYAKKHKTFKYDTKFTYKLESASIAYVGVPKKKAKRGVNSRLHKEIMIDREKKALRQKKEDDKHKSQDKAISMKQHQEELYGKREVKMKKETTQEKEKREYATYLKLKKKYEKK